MRMPHKINLPCGASRHHGLRPYRLRFAVKEVIHHDDVMCPIIIWPWRGIPARDPDSGNSRVGKDDTDERKASISWRGWGNATEEQLPVDAEALDLRAGFSASVLIARPAPIWQVNVRENRAEAADLCRHSSIGCRVRRTAPR